MPSVKPSQPATTRAAARLPHCVIVARTGRLPALARNAMTEPGRLACAAADQRAGARHGGFRQIPECGAARERPRRCDIAGGVRVAPEPFGDALPLVRIEPPLGKRRHVEKAGAFILDRVDRLAALPENPIGDICPRLAPHRMFPSPLRLRPILRRQIAVIPGNIDPREKLPRGVPPAMAGAPEPGRPIGQGFASALKWARSLIIAL